MKMKAIIAVILTVCLIGTWPASVTMAFTQEDWPADVREFDDADYSGKTVILTSNDVHGAIEGYAVMAKLGDDFREKGAEVMLVDAGDFSQGDAYVSVSKGEDAVTMMNAAGYELATLGNHEFDYGYEQIKSNLSKAEFKLICANILKDGKSVLDPTYIHETTDGAKIGFFALDTPETQTKANPKLTEGLDFLAEKEMYQCAQEQIDSLKNEGADLVIGLTHLGVDQESAEDGNRSIDLYENTTGIDFIIDGHSHTVMTEGMDHEPIQSTGTKFAYVGVIVLEGGKITDHYLISEDGLAQDDEVEEYAKKIEEKVDKEYDVKFAESEVVFEGDRVKNRTEETNNGDLITDALLWFADQNPNLISVDSDHVIAWENGGGIRDQIPKGDVTKKDINTVYPFGNTVCIVNLKGEDILEALEASTYCTPDEIGGYPQTGAFKWSIDTSKEFESAGLYPGSTYEKPASINRVKVQSVHDKPFDPEAEYAVVTNDFVMAGGDTCYVFGEAPGYNTGYGFDELLMSYITDVLNGVLPESKYGSVRGDVTIDGEGSTYSVESGDSLWKIAERIYGDGKKWTVIYSANTDTVIDPSLIYAGQELKIPAA